MLGIHWESTALERVEVGMSTGTRRLGRCLPPNTTNLPRLQYQEEHWMVPQDCPRSLSRCHWSQPALMEQSFFPCEFSQIQPEELSPLPLQKVSKSWGIPWATCLAVGRIKPLLLRGVLGLAPSVLWLDRIPLMTVLLSIHPGYSHLTCSWSGQLKSITACCACCWGLGSLPCPPCLQPRFDHQHGESNQRSQTDRIKMWRMVEKLCQVGHLTLRPAWAIQEDLGWQINEVVRNNLEEVFLWIYVLVSLGQVTHRTYES